MPPVYSAPHSDSFARNRVVKPHQPGTGPVTLAVIVFGVALVVFSTTVFAWVRLESFRLQPLVILVVAAGFRLPLLPGGLAVFFLGYLSDLLSGGFAGLQVTALEAVFIVCALAELKLEVSTWLMQMATVGLMTILFIIMVGLGLSLVHQYSHSWPDLLWTLLAQTAVNALFAPFFFGTLEGAIRFFDRLWPRKWSGES